MSGRGVKYAHATKYHDGYVLTRHSSTRTRRRLAEHQLMPVGDEFFSAQDARDLVETRYRSALPIASIRQKIAQELVGKPKKVSNVRPRMELLLSRLEDLEELESNYQFRNISEDELVKEAADVMLYGGSRSRRRSSRSSRKGLCAGGNQFDIELIAEASKPKLYDGGLRLRSLKELATKEGREMAKVIAANPLAKKVLQRR